GPGPERDDLLLAYARLACGTMKEQAPTCRVDARERAIGLQLPAPAQSVQDIDEAVGQCVNSLAFWSKASLYLRTQPLRSFLSMPLPCLFPPPLRTTLRALVCASLLGASWAPSQAAAPWTEAPYSYYAENTSLAQVLGDFASSFSLSLELSPQVK